MNYENNWDSQDEGRKFFESQSEDRQERIDQQKGEQNYE
jgi:hypothetical protein